MTTDKLELVHRFYQLGKDAFERGQYRAAIEQLEKACGLVNRASPLGGEVQMWLVTAYEAAGLREEAIALCETVSRHPDVTARKQGRRLLYILRAPRLKPRPEWITPIPDLSTLEDGSTTGQGISSYRPLRHAPSDRGRSQTLNPSTGARSIPRTIDLFGWPWRPLPSP